MKILFIKFLASICFLQMLISCHEKLPESKALAAEVKKRKIGRIKPLEVVNETKRLGSAIVQHADSIWWVKLKNELASQKRTQQSVACNIVAGSFKNYSLSDVLINKLGHKNILTNGITTQEQQLYEAYQYNADSRLAIADNVQKVGDSLMLYTQPIFFDNAKCGNCHSWSNNHSFAGMWSVRIRKRLIIENIWLNH